jgi:predicted DNA-binding transcriptional regulator AlpA
MVPRSSPGSRKSKRVAAAPSSLAPPASDNAILIGQSKLRRQLSVSPMTFWRWLHDEKLAFPAALRINNRVYFRWADVQAWLARQQQAA